MQDFPRNIGRSMVSPVPGHPLSDFQVTAQALLIGDLFAQGMALGAIRKPLQVGMGSRQLAR